MKKRNTDGPAKGLGGIIKDIRQKAKNNSLFISALKKLINMTPAALENFLGKTQTLFGRLKKVGSSISLETTEYFVVRNFFKTKVDGGIFVYVGEGVYKWFNGEIKNSPAKELASYRFTKEITSEDIISDAKTGGIYEEVDLAHIYQICYRHIVKGEKLFKEDELNIFWVRTQKVVKGQLCELYVWVADGGWCVDVSEFCDFSERIAGNRSFFRN
jgi:hypothetical protein